jgi:cystathionine beta-lyase/cystathionine gamma-synthase
MLGLNVPEQTQQSNIDFADRRKKTESGRIDTKLVTPALTNHHDNYQRLYDPSLVESMVAAANSTEIVSVTLTRALPGWFKDTHPIDIHPDEARRLLALDIQERMASRIQAVTIGLSKIRQAELITQANTAYRQNEQKLPTDTISPTVLKSLEQDVAQSISHLEALTENLLSQETDPLTDFQSLQTQKQSLSLEISKLATSALATERVSPAPGHTGVVQMLVKDAGGIPYHERGAGTYTRFHAGSWAHQLGLNIAREYGFPHRDNLAQVECFTSGMAALTTVMNSIAETPGVETVMTSGFYFEVPGFAEKRDIVIDTTRITDQLYVDLAQKIRQSKQNPLVYYAQPFSSGVGDEIFDVDRFLKVIETSDFDRPVTLMMDTTMHGGTLNLWDRVKAIVASGKHFTLIEVQSLVKHGQAGMDKAPGGVAMGYGEMANAVVSNTGQLGTMMPEPNAAVLFPFNGEVQAERIAREGRNAEYLAAHLQKALEGNAMYQGIYYSPFQSDQSKEAAKQYPTKPPFFFIKVNPLCKDHLISQFQLSVGGIHKNFPGSGYGASYGFDGTRFDEVTIDATGESYLRVVAGQESVLQVMAMSLNLERQLTDPRLAESVCARVEHNINMATANMAYVADKPTLNAWLPTWPETKEETRNRRFSLPESYLQSQFNGHAINKLIEENPQAAATLHIDSTLVDKLKTTIDSESELRRVFTAWAISQPEFVEKFREKLSLLGKVISDRRAFDLAKMATSPDGVNILLKPVAMAVRSSIKEVQKELEDVLRAEVPFDI